MSNTKENQDDDEITVSKIYETLKSRPYLDSMYWDLLADLKETDTFKKMRMTIEQLLNKKSEDIVNLSNSESDNKERKKIVAEICSMSYAIDTVFSKIMFIKLEKEFKTHIVEALKDLRQEKKIPDSIWYKLQISDDPDIKGPAENSAAKNNSLQQKPETSCRPVRMKHKKITSVELATKNKEIQSEIHEDLKAINCDESKVSKPPKSNNAGNQVRKKVTASPTKSTSKKRQAEENWVSTKLNTVTKKGEDKVISNTEDKIIPSEDRQFDNQGSDAESEVSVGNVSLASVSSVHTSDLSSFDDEISLSSEDGETGVKRKFTLTELKEMSNNGLFSSNLNGLLLKNLAEKEGLKKRPSTQNDKQIESSAKSDTKIESTDSSVEDKSQPQKTLPKRIRKPNSRYSSDNILCTIKTVKERKKPSVDGQSDARSSSSETNSKDLKTSCDIKKYSVSNKPSRKRAKSDVPDLKAETPSKIMKAVEIKEETDPKSHLKSSHQQSSSELYKRHVAVHSLTSRKTAPVTLYST